MQTPKYRLGLVVASLAMGTGSVMAGDLNPPPGAVGPSMKSLDAIEPRNILKTYLGSPDSVHRISAPGQYYATEAIVVPAGKHGILIDLPPGATGGITIDLNGFEIQGQPGSLDGVRKSGAFSAADFNLHNGRIVGMGGDGVHIENLAEAHICVSIVGGGGDGMEFMNVPVVSAVAINSKAPPPGAGNIVKGMGGHCVRASGCDEVLIDYTLTECGLDGVHVEGGTRLTLSVDVADCGGNGIDAASVSFVEYSSARDQLMHKPRHRVANCGGSGVVLGGCGEVEFGFIRISGMGGGGGGVPGTGCGIKFGNCGRVAADDVVITDSLSHGIEVSDCGRTSLRAVRLSNVGGNGLHATASSHGKWIEISDWSWDIEADTVAGDGIHISGISTVHLLGGSLSNCGGDGIHIEDGTVSGDKFVQVRGFQVELCAGSGMEIECDDLTMSGCTTQDNGGNGVYGKNIRKNITVTLHKSHRNGLNGLLVNDGAARGGVRQQGKSTQVTRSNISNNRAAGVYVETAGSLSMDEVECDGNDNEGCFALLLPALGSVQEKAKQVKCRFNNNGFGTPTAYPGAVIQGATSIEMREVECSGNASSGLVVTDFERDGRLDLVTCSANGGHGMHIFNSIGLPNGRLRVRDLFTDGNAATGMLLESTTGGEIAECTSTNNGGAGMMILGSGHTVRSNSCSNNVGGSLIVTVPGNTLGPLVDEMTAGGNCNPGANYVR